MASSSLREGSSFKRALSASMALDGINTRGLHFQLVDCIGQMIVGGELSPGEQLPPEDELGRHFDVSRTVIRETIRVLASKGLVAPRPKTGTRVLNRDKWSLLDPAVLRWQQNAGPTEEFLKDFEEIRALLEPEAARRAAERGSSAQKSAIRSAYEQMVSAAESNQDEPVVEADLSFHRAVFACD